MKKNSSLVNEPKAISPHVWMGAFWALVIIGAILFFLAPK
jgi:hypothetical protein